MKKYFEKHDLVKLVGIFIIIVILLTWLCKISYFADGQIQYESEFLKFGLFDLMAPISTIFEELGASLVPPILFILFVFGFYKFLGSTKVYNDLIKKFQSGIPSRIMVAISTLFFALLSAIVTNHYVLILFIPFVMSLLSRMKVDKVSGVAATVGGILVGIIANTYSLDIVGRLSSIGVSYGYELVNIVILFAVAYIIVTYFTISRMNKVSGKKDVELLEDIFVDEEKLKNNSKKKVNIIPLVILMCLAFVLVIMGFIGWKDSFGIEFFENLHNSLIGAKIFGVTIFNDIMGSSALPLGDWSLYTAIVTLGILSLIIKIIYRIPLDDVLDNYGEGFKKGLKTAFIFLLVYSVGLFTALAPTIPAFVDRLLGIGTNFATLFISSGFVSLFAVDFTYTTNILYSVFVLFESSSVAGIALQSSHGIIGLLAPTSVLLMIGLSMYNVKFKDWFKHIWLCAVALTVVVFIILAIIMYM